MCDYIASNRNTSSQLNNHRVVLLGSSKLKCQQSKSNSVSNIVKDNNGLTRQISAPCDTMTHSNNDEKGNKVAQMASKWPAKSVTDKSEEIENINGQSGGGGTADSNIVANPTHTDNEHLLVEIVTLNRALIAAREGNLKLLQASVGCSTALAPGERGPRPVRPPSIDLSV